MMPSRRATASVASSLASSTSRTASTTSRGIARKHFSSVFSARYAGITTTIFCPCSMESFLVEPPQKSETHQMIHGQFRTNGRHHGSACLRTLLPCSISHGAGRNSDDALQQLRISDLFPAAFARGLFCTRAQGDMGRRLASRGVTVLLRLVEPEVSAADPGKHRFQLLRRPRLAPKAPPRHAAARLRRRLQLGLA